MEVNSLIHKPKRQKRNEEQDIDGNSKCFGNLPDVVLRHILSFLHIKYAVRTSVLSKRWEFLWTSIPYLNFGKPLPAKRTLHMNFVERVFCLRDSDIIEFALNCDVQLDSSRVKSRIAAAVRRNVQSLRICLSDLRGQFSLPHYVFTCETLRQLFLDMPCILKVPPIICFSNLKLLNIKSVTFSDDYTTQQLFSGLPALEILSLDKCKWGYLKVLSISAPKLHSLTINEADMQNPSDCEVIICGATLKEFYYTGEFFNEYLLYNPFSLEIAEIDVTRSDGRARQVAYRMFKVFIGLPIVKDLRLFGSAVEVLTYAAELLPVMPIFNNLVYLELGSLNLSCAALLKILQNSVCLETLFICEINLFSDGEKDDVILDLDPVPPCFFSHLKNIEVNGCSGHKKELSVLKILLKNAVVLKEITITCSENFGRDLQKHKNLNKQLIKLPKGSQNCKIVLK